MKIIDFQKKGQSVRFLLGEDNLEDWTGDDWNDMPYEHNAGGVYDEYVAGYIDITFGFDDIVLEPKDDWRYQCNSPWCKDDMKARLVPCLLVVPQEIVGDRWIDDAFSVWLGADGVKKFYFGDKIGSQAPFIRGLPK